MAEWLGLAKKQLLFWGMLLQAVAIAYLIFASSYFQMVLVSVFLGIGTAMVYPTFLATISDNTHALDRAKSLGIFRFWRDSGYVFGALLAGVLADIFGLSITLIIVAGITVLGGVLAEIRMCCTLRHFWKSNLCSEAAVY